jgi:hypothetical protein
VFRRSNKAAIEAGFLQVLLLARELGLLKLGTVSIDGTKIDANASKIRSVRYDRAKELRAKLAADIASLMTQAEAADAEERDPQALPAELARRDALKLKLRRMRRGPTTKPKRQHMMQRKGGADSRRKPPMMSRRQTGKPI